MDLSGQSGDQQLDRDAVRLGWLASPVGVVACGECSADFYCVVLRYSLGCAVARLGCRLASRAAMAASRSSKRRARSTTGTSIIFPSTVTAPTPSATTPRRAIDKALGGHGHKQQRAPDRERRR